MPFTVARSAAEWTAHFGKPSRPTVVTIGNFDGVHRGHQAILNRVRSLATGNNSIGAALTFYPHPAKILRPSQAPALLMTLDQRLAAMKALGLDAALVVPFDAELAKVAAEDFIRHFLVDTMSAQAVLVGENFRFGHGQAGDVHSLSKLGAQWGFEVEIVPPVEDDGIIISSTAVRNALLAGKVDDAARMLGRPFVLSGEIRPGTGQGRTLIVPTLNLATQQELLPKTGVYAAEVSLGDKIYQAATNVGMRPTFDGKRLSVESNLLEFDESLTSGSLEVHFRRRLRDERKFSNPAELREQVLRDIEQARDYFKSEGLEIRGTIN